MEKLHFNIEQIERLFPCYLLINQDLTIIGMGKSIANLLQPNSSYNFFEHFEIVAHDSRKMVDFQELKQLASLQIFLKIQKNKSVQFKGNFEFFAEGNHLLYTGVEVAGTTEQALLNTLKAKTDLTERVQNLLNTIRRHKTELRKLSLLAQETVNGVLITDTQGKIEWVNKGFEKITGYNLEECKGKSPGSFLQGAESDIETKEYLKTQILEKQAFTCEIINYHKSGKKYWVRINGQALHDHKGIHTGFFAIEEDISIEKENKQNMLLYEERFRVALEKIGDNVWIHDYETEKTEFSKNDSDFLGYDLSLSETNASLWWKCIHEDDLHLLEENNRAYKNGSIDHHNLEYRIIHKSGKIKWVLDRGIVFEYKNNAPTKIIGTHTDITQLKLTEKALQELKKFYETILNNIPADIAVFDKDHKYLFVNPRGIKNSEIRNWIIGKTDEEYIRLRNKPRYILEGRKALFNEVHQSKKIKSWEEEFIKPDGTKEYILRNMYPHLNEQNEVELVISYGVDITQRKRFEERLQLSEARYKNLINNSLALITIHDLNGVFSMINPMVCKVFGYSENEILGHSLTEFMPARDVPSLQSSYLDVIKAKKQANGVFRMLNSRSDIIFILYNNFLMEEPGKEPYVISYAVDITERIKIEKELKLAKEETEEAAIAKERFLANMSHEIRTPMNGILGITNFLAKTELSPKQREYISLIRESTGNLLVILNDVLDLEKIIAGKLEFEHVPFNLSEKIKAAVESFRYKAEEKELFLEFKNNLPENLFVEGDSHRLSQVLLNLISNAVKFTEEGGIVVSVKIESETETDYIVEFAVKDTGIGVAQDKVMQIFDPFVQAKTDISRKYGGTGLGLSICKNLIEMQRGYIEVLSEEHKGSTFIFIIPYKKTTEAIIEEQITLNHEIMKNKRILVAEDVEINQYVMKSTLDNWGCITTVVDNGKKAIEALQSEDFDLILMDIQMPEMNGFEATNIIRSLPNTKKSSLPIIAVTANSLDGVNEKYVKSGMNDYILKPFEEHKLFAVMEKYLNTSGESITVTQQRKTIYNLSEINKIAGNNEAFLKKMAEIFVRTAPETFANMQKALDANDWQELAREAHKLKSSIKSMGITPGTNLIETIEQRCKQEKELDTIEELCNAFNSVLTESIQQLKKDFLV